MFSLQSASMHGDPPKQAKSSSTSPFLHCPADKLQDRRSTTALTAPAWNSPPACLFACSRPFPAGHQPPAQHSPTQLHATPTRTRPHQEVFCRTASTKAPTRGSFPMLTCCLSPTWPTMLQLHHCQARQDCQYLTTLHQLASFRCSCPPHCYAPMLLERLHSLQQPTLQA